MTMTVTKQQIIDAAAQSGFTDKEYGHIYATSAFDDEVGVEEYACG